MKSLVTSCLIAICTAIPACCQARLDNWETQAIAVDSLFRSIDTQSQPGCSVGIIYGGRFIHRGNYGAANLEYGIPLSSKSVFRIGSVSKQFTAIAILLLEEQGKLSLDADVHEYLPDLINYQSPVTLRHMLWHTSGMAEYMDANITAFKNVKGEPFRWGNEDYLTTSEFMAILSQLPLHSPPNQKFRYSNSAYFLLSQVIKAVSGQSLREFAQDNIFEPLKMETSSFNDNVNRVITNRATGLGHQKMASTKYFKQTLPGLVMVASIPQSTILSCGTKTTTTIA
ncbi:MAG: serine hydrolase [Pseudomonadales bacterium]|jgi:CubicO group peptidase (beta-lactamase class C family)|nr:serine hydrolase [Pseudomonadales bacterium]